MLETIAIVITYCYAIPCCTAVILHFLPSHLEPVRSADKETKTTASAALWLRVTFSWINPLIGLGANLEGRDLKRFMDADDAPDALYDKFSRTRRSDSLARRIIAFNRHELAWQFTFALLFSLSEYVSPYFFQLFLRCIQESTPAARSTAFRYLMIMLAAEIGKTVFETQMLHISRRIDIRLKSVLPLEIFARALSSTDHSGHPPSTSQSDGRDAEDPVDINLTSDVNRIAEAANRIHGIYTAPLSLIFGVVQLYQLLGWSALVGLATMSAAVLLSSGCSVTFSRIMGHVMSIRDNRLALTRELIQGIRTIKINAWERPFTDKIFKVRELELERMRAGAYTPPAPVSSLYFSPLLFW
ncbi:hypothetical protein BC938DRAFT_477372 [Jimgerdemannia flammicorona]|uniref:ABC transmembrane type-1 domain-containing protein n=1 Tax=Jimgerdemannia flammicorona TaxID=994334 RepID=A0A433QPG2_9FUNG|nr:hypothetical protein BC938DRAFT_477372 [Jimgerdemannia flammicorona]